MPTSSPSDKLETKTVTQDSQLAYQEQQLSAIDHAILTDHVQVSTELLDWTDPHPGIGKFDVLLACDVLYEQEAVQPMADLIGKLISEAGGRFILADPESRTKAHR